MQPSVQALFFPHTAPALPDGVEITRYRNAGRGKIYEAAMLWILFGFASWPFYAVWYTITLWPQHKAGAFAVWPYLWRRQLQVWGAL